MLVQGRRAGRLAKILLRQPDYPAAVTRQPAVEALHYQRLQILESGDATWRREQSERVHDLRTQPFVFNRCAHVSPHIAHQPHGQLQYVRRRRAAGGTVPLAAMQKQGRLFLRAGNRQAEVRLCAGMPERGFRDRVAQYPRHASLVERLARDAKQVRGYLTGRQ